LRITAPDKDGYAAFFNKCINLKIAEGTFPGLVNFDGAGITAAGNLTITNTNGQGYKANFTNCDLRLPNKFLGSEYLMDKAIRQEDLARNAASKALKASPEIEI
jgi:hypothetical protein